MSSSLTSKERKKYAIRRNWVRLPEQEQKWSRGTDRIRKAKELNKDTAFKSHWQEGNPALLQEALLYSWERELSTHQHCR